MLKISAGFSVLQTHIIFDFKSLCFFFFHPSLLSKDVLHYVMTVSGSIWSCSTLCVVCDHIHHLAARRWTQGWRSKQVGVISRRCGRWLQPWGEESWAAEQQEEERRAEERPTGKQHSDENYSQPSGSKWVFTLNGEEGRKSGSVSLLIAAFHHLTLWPGSFSWLMQPEMARLRKKLWPITVFN